MWTILGVIGTAKTEVQRAMNAIVATLEGHGLSTHDFVDATSVQEILGIKLGLIHGRCC